ncbi:NAD(P)/FAD-dependent oxidoreductase [Alkalilimnicola ehrlichii]|nr:FAD-dependent oxidoreductase [Alkalilimnicola ehrlichii]
MKIALVGAGLAGLTCAQNLHRQGHSTTLFEASAKVGGRTASPVGRAENLDDGAQYFTARDERFRHQVQQWVATGLAAEWQARIGTWEGGRFFERLASEPRFVGTPDMSGFCTAMGERLSVRYDHTVVEINRQGGQWTLSFADETVSTEAFDAVVTAVPAPIAGKLLTANPQLAQQAETVAMSRCWAVGLRFSQRLPIPVDGAFCKHPVLSWIARNNTKPGRHCDEQWLLHATPEWSAQHAGLAEDEAATLLIDAFQALTGHAAPPQKVAVYEWPYAASLNPLDAGYLLDAELRLGACGDWCHGNRIEGAYLSGLKLAEALGKL